MKGQKTPLLGINRDLLTIKNVKISISPITITVRAATKMKNKIDYTKIKKIECKGLQRRSKEKKRVICTNYLLDAVLDYSPLRSLGDGRN